ncbi:MAG TPA: DUF1707 domain-containing protein [Solirubrobacteraceae bacterium]|nr:DUF1707 domain-containing protein [Solirubrobacteraceae bacterium]
MFRLLPEDLRASDADREETVEFLKRHYAEGRLSATELATRVDAAYAAVGLSKLGALTRDLPPLPPARTEARPVGLAQRATRLFAVALAVMGILVIASVIPAELWAMLLLLALPLAMMLLFGLLPLALPVLAMAWLARSLGAGPPSRQLGGGSAPRGRARVG